MAGKIDYNLATPDQIAADTGQRLAHLRLSQNVSQAELATQSGISERTLRRLEAGQGCSFDTLIRIMQALKLGGYLQALLPDPGIQPVERLARGIKEPQRVSRKRQSSTHSEWSWDEDLTP